MNFNESDLNDVLMLVLLSDDKIIKYMARRIFKLFVKNEILLKVIYEDLVKNRFCFFVRLFIFVIVKMLDFFECY